MAMVTGSFLLPLLILTLFSLHASGDPKYISMPSTRGGVTHNRHLLQVLKSCPVNFQVQNYTIITSECKGPQYPQNACCSAFVKFACPFAEQINDNTTDCATTMFNYINIYGRYPAGLFANECHGDDQGLPCPASSTNASSLASSTDSSDAGSHASYHQALWWMVTIFSALLLFGAEWVN